MSIDGQRHIVAISGGSFEPDGRFGLRPSALLRYALDLTGADRPRVCFLTTAVGDAPDAVSRFYAGFTRLDVEVTHLALFPMPNHPDPRAHLLAQDLVYVSGGSVANLLALWRLHGLDAVFREAWEAGVVLTGQSAGSICWHAGGTTDSFGPDLCPVANALAFVPYANGVHYDAEPQRRPVLHRLIADGTLPAAYAADNGVALHYVGTDLVQAVSTGEGVAYWVEEDGTGSAREKLIEPRRLA
ncbi:MAG: Type 1 glutamine amidotransferase-like domain-containing protein [Streptosporangiaceae bacterium]